MFVFTLLAGRRVKNGLVFAFPTHWFLDFQPPAAHAKLSTPIHILEQVQVACVMFHVAEHTCESMFMNVAHALLTQIMASHNGKGQHLVWHWLMLQFLYPLDVGRWTVPTGAHTFQGTYSSRQM